MSLSPFVFRRVKALSVAGLLAFAANAFAVPPVVGENTPSFRLSGIVDTGSTRLAVIELGNGGTLVVREGDKIPAGQVLEITMTWIRIALEDGEQVFRLEGGPPRVSSAESEAAVATPLEEENAPETGRQVVQVSGTNITWHVKSDAMLKAIASAGSILEALDIAATGLELDTGSSGNIPLDAISQRLPEAGVETIDGRPILSEVAGMQMLREALAQEYGVLIGVSGIPDVETIYLHPESTGIHEPQ